jgi:hypothetical protein
MNELSDALFVSDFYSVAVENCNFSVATSPMALGVSQAVDSYCLMAHVGSYTQSVSSLIIHLYVKTRAYYTYE